MQKFRVIFYLLLCLFIIPGVNALTVVSTTTVLWDPVQYIGGEHVEAIYIADPTICPHMQADIIPSRIQMQTDFISTADLFVAHNGSVDAEYVMPYVTDFMAANEYGTVDWVSLEDPSMTWNTPAKAKALAAEVAEWLIDADPSNRSYYEGRLADYLGLIDAVDLTDEERQTIPGQDAVVMIWQEEAAEQWLGLDLVTIYAPEFYERGQFTPRAVVNDIYNNPEKFQDVKYVVENMQSGEMAKGVEEALRDRGIPAKRVIFTNFPKSIPGVESLPDVLAYNKALVTPDQTAAAAAAPANSSPLPCTLALAAVMIGCPLFLIGRKKQ
jgi:zinc/manganese transport system substrate-binding protein